MQVFEASLWFLLGHNSSSESHCYKWQPNPGSSSVNLGSNHVQVGLGRISRQSLTISHRWTCTWAVWVPLQSLTHLTKEARLFILSWIVHFVINQQVIYPREQNQPVLRWAYPPPHCFLIATAAPPERQLLMSPGTCTSPSHSLLSGTVLCFSVQHPGSIIYSITFYCRFFCHRLSCCVMQMSLLMVLGICQCSYLYRSSGFGPYICRVLKEISGRIETGSLTIYLWMICEQGKSSSKLSAMNY